MKPTTPAPRQNITVSLPRETLQKAKVLAAQRNTSISGLLAAQIEVLVGGEEAYTRAQKRALELMDRGFDMGPHRPVTRDELHER